MNKENQTNELILSGIHLELTPSLKTYVREKTDRLFKHEPRIERIRIELECDMAKEVNKRFTAKGRIEIAGPDMVASVSTEECHKSVSFLVEKLDGMIRHNWEHRKEKRNHPRPVEIDVELPKI